MKTKLSRRAKIGRNVRSIRESVEFTRTELAAAVGVSERTIANIENGKVAVSLKRAEDICAALNCSIEQISSLN